MGLFNTAAPPRRRQSVEGDVPIALKLRRADVAGMDVARRSDVGNGLDCHAIAVKLEGPHPDRQLLMRLQSSEALVGLDHAGRGPSQGHAGVLPAFDVARDAAMVPIMFSAILVEASDRRSSVGTFNQTTVRISSRPWRMVAATPGHCWSSRRARLRINFSASSASSSQAWLSTRHVAA